MTKRKKIPDFHPHFRLRIPNRCAMILNSSCAVRDRSFFNPHFVIKGCWLSKWFAGLPSAFCGRMLEAIKRAAGDPPGLEGAGYNGVYTAERGTGKYKSRGISALFIMPSHAEDKLKCFQFIFSSFCYAVFVHKSSPQYQRRRILLLHNTVDSGIML